MKNEFLEPKKSNSWYLTLNALRQAIKELAPRCQGIVADYGCGTKPYRSLFAAATQYIGFDLNVVDDADVKLRSDFGLPLADETVDAVVSTQVLEHVPTIDRYLKECHRVLRRGGHLLLTTHGVWPYHTANAEDYYRWTATGLKNDLGRNGFTIVEIISVCPGWISIAQQVLNATCYYPQKLVGVRRRLFQLLCIIVNSLVDAVWRFNKIKLSRSETIPICYALLATKNIDLANAIEE